MHLLKIKLIFFFFFFNLNSISGFAPNFENFTVFDSYCHTKVLPEVVQMVYIYLKLISNIHYIFVIQIFRWIFSVFELFVQKESQVRKYDLNKHEKSNN